MSAWRMAVKCADCPFAKDGAGAHLRRSLGKGRMASIKRGLRRGEHFMCHKTTHETGNGKPRVCAGSLEYQESVGASSSYVRVCERLDWFTKNREASK